MSAVLKALPLPRDEFARVIDELIERRARRVTTVVLSAIDWLREEVGGRLQDVEAVADWEEFARRLREMERELAATAAQAAEQASRQAGRPLAFDPATIRAAEWIAERGAQMVREIADETRQAIRDAVARAWNRGLGVDQLAREVRPLIGLTRRMALAVDNYRARLIEDGVPPGRAADMAGKYANKLLRYRAYNIARTEMQYAANMGAQRAWEYMQAEGLVAPDAQKEWLTAADELVCPICAPMDGVRVPLNQPYQTAVGPLMAPPAHPQCRCTHAVVVR
ncbi:MAG: hypothetical protein HPY55_15815 [Firmicutes bacterium]|nr:hypothetical protein [Bacillota bacterium]